MHSGTDDSRRNSCGKIAVADEANASAGRTNVSDEFLVPRTIKNNHDEIFHIALQTPGDVLQIVGYRRVKLNRILARRPHDDFLHVAVWSVKQASTFGSGQHRDRPGSAGSTQIRAFQWIDGDVDFGHISSVVKLGPYLLADIKHGRLVTLTLADDDGAAHRDGVHGFAHGLGGDFVAELALALAHGARRSDGGNFDHAQEFERQIAFDVFAETAGLAFGASLRAHGNLPARLDTESRAGLRL